MPPMKISQLPAAAALAGPELLPVVQDGATVQSTVGAMRAGLATYQEGVWTPTLVGTSVVGTQTHASQIGRYARVGNLVTIWFQVTLSAKDPTASGAVRITGLPFPVVSGIDYTGTVGIATNVTLDSGYTGLSCAANWTSAIRFNQVGSAATSPFLQMAALADNTMLRGVLSYRTTP